MPSFTDAFSAARPASSGVSPTPTISVPSGLQTIHLPACCTGTVGIGFLFSISHPRLVNPGAGADNYTRFDLSRPKKLKKPSLLIPQWVEAFAKHSDTRAVVRTTGS